jgi:RNA-binding protein 39
VRAQREREKELEALERDTRTVFAYNVNTKADDRDLFQFFSQAGTVTDVRIITDRNTKRSKGFAYIEMSNKLEVGSALALSGQPLRGQAVMVKASEAEKNMAWEANQQATLAQKNAAAGMGGMPGMGGMGDMSAGPCKLAVSNVHPNIGVSPLSEYKTQLCCLAVKLSEAHLILLPSMLKNELLDSRSMT